MARSDDACASNLCWLVICGQSKAVRYCGSLDPGHGARQLDFSCLKCSPYFSASTTYPHKPSVKQSVYLERLALAPTRLPAMVCWVRFLRISCWYLRHLCAPTTTQSATCRREFGGFHRCFTSLSHYDCFYMLLLYRPIDLTDSYCVLSTMTRNASIFFQNPG